MKRAGVWAVSFGLLIWVVGFYSGQLFAGECDGITVNECLKRAADLKKSGDSARSGIAYQEAVLKDPNNPRAHLKFGAWLREEKLDKKAIEEFTKAIDNSTNPELWKLAHWERGSCFYRQKDYISAGKDYSKVLELNPKDAEAYFYRYLCTKNREDLNKAGELGNANAKAELKKIEMNSAQAKPQEGQKSKDVLSGGECDGISINDCLKKGIALQKNSDSYRAGLAFRQAVAKEPNNPVATFYLGRYLVFGNEPEKGIENLTKTINNSTDPKLTAQAYLSRGLFFLNDHKFGPAEKDFTKSIGNNPEKPHAYWYRYLCSKTGKGPQEHRDISAEKTDVEIAAKLGLEEAKKELLLLGGIESEKRKINETIEEEKRKRDEIIQVSDSKTKADMDYAFKNLREIIRDFNKEIRNPGKVDELKQTMLVGSSAHRVVIGSYLYCLFLDAANCSTIDRQSREQSAFANLCLGTAKEQIMYAAKEIQEDLIKLHKAVLNEYSKSPSRLTCKKNSK